MACLLATTASHPQPNGFATMLRPRMTGGRVQQAVLIPILVRAFGPLPPLLSFALPANVTVAYILAAIIRNLRLPQRVAQMLRLTRLGGQSVPANTPLAALAGPPMRNQFGQLVQQPITLEVRMGMRGGKGGFGSQLRAAGGKMSSSRNGEENRDSCRDLNGRRLSTVKQAQQLAAYVATQDERERALNEAQKRKYAKLERMLGRRPQGEAEYVEAAQKLHDQGEDLDDGGEGEDDGKRGEGSSSSRIIVPLAQRQSAQEARAIASDVKGKKRERIDDSQYVEQSRAIVDNVRSAVASAMLKKKRKAADARHTVPSTSKGEQGKVVAAPPAKASQSAQTA